MINVQKVFVFVPPKKNAFSLFSESDILVINQHIKSRWKKNYTLTNHIGKNRQMGWTTNKHKIFTFYLHAAIR